MVEKQDWTYCVVGNIKKNHYSGWWGKSKSEKADAEEFAGWWNETLNSSEREAML